METEVSALARLLDELRRIKVTAERSSDNDRSSIQSILAKLTQEAKRDRASLP